MKIAVFSVNLSFFGDVQSTLINRGHEVRVWQPSAGLEGSQTAELLSWCDIVFFEFCQTPLGELLGLVPKGKKVVARLHRLEIYNNLTKAKEFDWSRVDMLIASAPHVLDRFVNTRQGMSVPKKFVVSLTNNVDVTTFKYAERVWEPPYKILMCGNFVPKKRQYTLIQMFQDVRTKLGDNFTLDILGARGMWTGYGNVEYYENCLDLIDDLGLDERVRIYDKVDHKEVANFMGSEHFIVSNSNEEGTHVSIAEGGCTGCIPLVNSWRGAGEVYPDAHLFKTPLEFVEKIEKITQMDMAAESARIAELFKEKYGNPEKMDALVTLLEGLV